jgi:hypothetical protein
VPEKQEDFRRTSLTTSIIYIVFGAIIGLSISSGTGKNPSKTAKRKHE